METQLEDAASWDATPTTPARARALTEQLLRRNGLDELVRTVTLLTSEVVTNAVLHAGGRIAIRVICLPPAVRVEVADTSDDPPVPRTAGRTSPDGRGLELVEALASAWGTTQNGSGKVVWFEVGAETEHQASGC